MTETAPQLPAAFLERLSQLTPAEQLPSVVAAFAHPRPTTLRANTLKIQPQQLITQLAADGIELEAVPWWEAAFIVKNATLRQVVDHPLYQAGALYVQSLSSMIPPLVLNPQPGEYVLDLTAAPGSKTTQMAALMNNTGEITANDLSPVRLFKLQANLKMQGVKNTFVRRGPGELFWHKSPEFFRRTLADVPCSMEGRLSTQDPESYADWSLKKIRELSVRQKHILRSAISSTRVGGVIVYSTCTLAPEENEEVVNWVLEKEQGSVVLEPIQVPHLPTLPGLTEWLGEKYHPSLQLTARILPSSTMEGFFVALLRKTAPSHLPLKETHSRPHRFSHSRAKHHHKH